MRTQQTFPDWRTILFKGAQLHRLPLNEDEAVDIRTVIGKTAKRPLEIAMPFYVSHMSFGALSREAKIALARGTQRVSTAMCSGEGGMLPEEQAEAGAYIYELGTATFSHKDDAIAVADAVEIKIGQAAKPGLGGHLPGHKVTAEIAKIRGLAQGEDSISPGRHTGIDSREDLARRVDEVRKLCKGGPVGIKFAAGHVEEDLEFALSAGPDFITIDCRGGATGSAPVYVKDNVCLPPIFALRRARRYLDSVGSQVTLCITGGFRDSTDIAKALALGADAVALATASLIAIGCQQYRICQTGRCPVGITTQDDELRHRFDIEKSVHRFVNFYEATAEELANLARINGRSNVHDLDLSDVVTISNEVSHNTDIEHA
jgi:glutamate synthase domain-containing protein 2